jgi:hypothetical protein
MNNEIIEICRLNSFNIKVTEKINTKYIQDFVLTSLRKNGYILSHNSKVFYTYLDKINEYQISYFKSDQIDYIPIVELIDVKHVEPTLIVSSNFFAVFIDKSLYYFQKIESMMTLQEFKTYAQNRLKINIEHMEFINDKQLESLKNNHLQTHLNYVQSESLNSIKQYALYLGAVVLFTFMLTFFSFGDNNNSVQKDELNFLQQQYNNLVINKKISLNTSRRLLSLFNSMNQYELTLNQIKLDEKNAYLRLVSKDKKSIYSFIKHYQSTILVQSIQFDKSEVSYVLDASIKLYK